MAPEIKDFIRPTQIVRGVMRAYGRDALGIYTNNYKHCRTVKCYIRPGLRHTELIGDIRTALVKAGVVDFQIKVIDTPAFSTHRLADSLIVRIPKKEQA